MVLRFLTLLLAFLILSVLCVNAQDNDGFEAERDAATTQALRQLSDRDALVRQRAAEVMAKYSAVEHQRLVDGYRLQEKNDRVRLALDWALYRMGKTDALYEVVLGLRSDGRRLQAVDYLSQLAGPRPLYVFLDRADPKILIGLLQVLGRIGDAETLELIKQFEASVDPGVPDYARFAMREITIRLSQTPQDTPTRPRKVH